MFLLDLLTRYNWPATTKEDIKYGPNSEFHLSQFVVDWASVLKPSKAIYTKSSHSSPLPCVHIYPDNVKVEFKKQPTLDEIRQFQTEWTSSPQDLITVSPLPLNTVHIYVCCHTARDIRCGVIGELLISFFRKVISAPPSDIASALGEFDVKVFGCSHVGGHKYAGNVVIYRGDWKQGIWYGRVTPENVAEIVRETVIRGKVLGRHWRGGLPAGNWDPKEQISAEEAENRSECACQRM
jgi:hypothetical protein